jgi:hypothetical protein
MAQFPRIDADTNVPLGWVLGALFVSATIVSTSLAAVWFLAQLYFDVGTLKVTAGELKTDMAAVKQKLNIVTAAPSPAPGARAAGLWEAQAAE